MEINKKLLKEIEEYCSFNNIENIENEINNILRLGFNVIRFGTKPFESPKQVFLKEEPKNEEIIVKKKVSKKKKVEEQVVIDNPNENKEIVTNNIQATEEQPKTKRVRIIKNK